MDFKRIAETLWLDESVSADINAVLNSPTQLQGMDRASRNELLKTIDGLKEQLQQYKIKLRDVVLAYKSLAKEKEALEASLTALSTADSQLSLDVKGKAPASSQGQAPSGSQGREAENSADRTSDPLGITSSSSQEESAPTCQVSALRERVKTLTATLTTLNQEKSRAESQFLANNKQLRHENEELHKRVEVEKQRAAAKKAEFDQLTQELKGRIRSQQMEREKEQTDHALMLREMQKLLAEERAHTEQLELQLEEARRSLQEKDNNSAASQQCEQKLKELAAQLNSTRQRWQQAELKASQPSATERDLQKDLADLKAQNQQALLQEQRKAVDLEARMLQQSKLSEEHISSLEEKLSQLSENIGHYERLRFQDQQSIQKLKERLTQLDAENTALVRAAKTFSSIDYFDEEMDAQALVDKILHLKTRLLSINQQSERPIDMSDLFRGNKHSDDNCSMCAHHKEELDQVKEEFERYKLRAQSVLKNKHKDSASKEVEMLKDHVSELRERLKLASVQHSEEVEQLQVKLHGFSRSVLAQADAHKAEVSHLKNAHQKEVFVLELEAKKQRERTIALLAEKDQEIEKLRASMTTTSLHKTMIDHDYYLKFRDLGLEGVSDTDGLLRGELGPEQSLSENAVARLLTQSSGGSGSGFQGEGPMLHFSQEKARQEVEISILRKNKHQLEAALRELQHSVSLKEEKWQDVAQRLEDQVHKLQRDNSREGANLEYLKNVFLKFLTSYDYAGRSQMLNAITTILQFSPSEKDCVRTSTSLKF